MVSTLFDRIRVPRAVWHTIGLILAALLAYLIWRGTPAGDARKANSLLALWDDPDLAPVRAAMMNAQASRILQRDCEFPSPR